MHYAYLDGEVEKPAVQLLHVLDPATEEYEPASHVVQSVQSSAPSAFWYMPAGHLMHAEASWLPSVGRYVPCKTYCELHEARAM
jgi:hypothetical protein